MGYLKVMYRRAVKRLYCLGKELIVVVEQCYCYLVVVKEYCLYSRKRAFVEKNEVQFTAQRALSMDLNGSSVNHEIGQKLSCTGIKVHLSRWTEMD